MLSAEIGFGGGRWFLRGRGEEEREWMMTVVGIGRGRMGRVWSVWKVGSEGGSELDIGCVTGRIGGLRGLGSGFGLMVGLVVARRRQGLRSV